MAEPSGWTMVRIAWVCAGAVALALGAIGAVLPVLPTTPFVILAVFAFGKGSPALARRLEESRVFGKMIRDWRQFGAIASRVKAFAIAMMASVFGVSVALCASALVLILQAVGMGGASIFILTRPSRAK